VIKYKLHRYQKRAPGIHPSAASKVGVCLLRIYYDCTFEIEPMNSFEFKTQLTWDIGTALHDMFQTHLKNMYQDQFQAEVPLSDAALNVKSHTDGIFTFSQVRFILEAKSIKEGKEKASYGWDAVIHKPMEEHVRQLHFYMYLSDVPFGLVFYIGKNNSDLLEHPIAFDPNIWKDIQDKTVLPVLDSLKKGEAPVASPSWNCKWCPYYYACPRGYKKESNRGWLEWSE
jgi:CRISPR/Cas system-associated exonuclease Cas4 (RecB family)